MTRPPSPLHGELLAQPFTLAEARQTGTPISRLRCADVERLFRGVYRSRDGELDLVGRSRAFQLSAPENWGFSGPTAALLHGIPLPRRLEDDPLLHVIAIGGANAPRAAQVRGSRASAGLVFTEVAGIRVLTPADTWASLEPFLGADELVVAGDRLWDRFAPLASEASVDLMLQRMRGRRGVRRLALARELMLAGSHSPKETRLRLTLTRAGIPAGVPNGLIVINGRNYFGDLVNYKYRTLFEYDGDQHRSDSHQWARDVARLNELATEGWLVVRFTRLHSDAEKVHLARQALRSRGWQG